MTDQAALTSKSKPEENRLYMALELSLKEWKLAFSDGRSSVRLRGIAARDLQALGSEITLTKRHFGLAEETPVVSCYEAGREGFWVHRALMERGIQNRIVDSASIDVQRRKRAKTDRLDAGSLVRKLIRHERGEAEVWSVVRVPSVEAEDARQLHRDIGVLQREQQQHRMRIQSLLFTQGLAVKKVTPELIRNLDQLQCWNGQPVPADLQARIRREYARLELAEQDLKALRKLQQIRLKQQKTAAMEKVRRLQQLRGIAMTSSWVFVMELFWRTFKNRKELAGAMGLAPVPYQSGDSLRDQGISRAGNRRVRAMAIEIAWAWLRYQPGSELSQWYQRRFGSGGKRLRRIGIVAMARRLMIDLWRYLEEGTLPAGAKLKQAAAGA